MKIILILEDSDERIGQFRKNFINAELIIVKTSKEAIIELKNKKFDIIFLDHDLGGKVFQTPGENTGYEVAQWISKNLKDSKVAIHSLNMPAVKVMKNCLPEAIICPFIWIKEIDWSK